MQFSLDEPTKVKFTDVEVLSSKDRKPNENPGAALNVSMVVGNGMLSMFDGFLKSAMYTAVTPGTKVPEPEAQAQGDLVPPVKVTNAQIVSDMPKLTTIGMKLGEFSWDLECIGYLLHVEYGASGPNGISFNGCRVHKFRLFGQEGGSCVVKFRIEFGDVDSIAHGKLAMLKNCEAVITLTAPVVEGDNAPTNPLPFGGEDGRSFDDADEDRETPEQALAKSLAAG